jgi:broad specificity phosphatase PhoE
LIILLVRHGQTQWNQVERFRGHYDIPLNERGLAQAEATARRIASRWQPALVLSSSLSRAMVTAQKIAEACNLTAQAHPGLMDFNFGAWQGLSVDEARIQWPEQISDWIHTPQELVIPGGDTFASVQERALKVINDLSSDHEKDTVVLVSHTVVIRLMLLGVLGMSFQKFWTLRQDNCAINILFVEKDRISLVALNDACHLGPELK